MIRRRFAVAVFVLSQLHLACEGPAGPAGPDGPQGPPGLIADNLELVTITITDEHYSALYSPYRKVVLINDLRVWVSLDDQETDQPSYYYLVVPRTGPERSWGFDGDGAARPPSLSPCP